MTLRDTHTSTLSHTHTVRERERESVCGRDSNIRGCNCSALCNVANIVEHAAITIPFTVFFSAIVSLRLSKSARPIHCPAASPPLPPSSLPSYFINLLKGPTKNSLATFAARNGKVNKHERKGGGPREGGEGRGHGEIERKRNE